MNENQFTPETGNQQNQPLQDNLIENQTRPGNYQEEDSEIGGRTTQQEFPERTQQHDYKNPSANQLEDDEDDEVDTDVAIFDKDDETHTDNETDTDDEDETDDNDVQTDVSNLGLV